MRLHLHRTHVYVFDIDKFGPNISQAVTLIAILEVTPRTSRVRFFLFLFVVSKHSWVGPLVSL